MFQHLSVRSFYSFGYGTASVEQLCSRARALGFETLALTDVNGLYALGWFLQSCKENHLIPVIGSEIRHRSGRAVLLAHSRAGYSNLCHIISARHLNPDFSLAQAVSQWRGGLVIISDSFRALLEIAAAGGHQNLYVELRPGRNRTEAMSFSRKTAIPPIVTGDAHFLDAADYELHVKLCAIHHKKTITTISREELASPDAWLKSAKQVESEFGSYPQALAGAEAVAKLCAGFRLDFSEPIFPRFAGENEKTAGEMLRELTLDAVKKKYSNSPDVVARLESELEIIIRKGFADTFLMMREIVSRARFTCGRGSAAASLVSYLLQITNVDPVSCDLYFGRFLNDARTDPPDVDIDFCQDERRYIINSVYSQFGEANTAMVANHCHMGMRQAIRRLAEIEGLAQAEIAMMTRHFSGWGGSIAAFYERHPVFRGVKVSDRWPAIFKDAERLVGIPTHLSLHPGGMVVASAGIDYYIPRQRSANGLIAIQTEKEQTEDILRFVKFDVLGNTSLCVVRDTLAALKAQKGIEIDYRDWRTFAADGKARELIARARTMACFHIESASFLQLLEKVGPGLETAGPQRIFDVLVILSSIIRPSSNNNIREFLRRFFGGTFEYSHPKLEEILGETFGLPVYQEHVNLMAMALAGFSEVDADRLRKALTGKKSEQRIRDLIRKYVDGCIENGVSREVANQTAGQILQFTNYSFLKAHSAAYITLAIACVYLKAHYPAQFMAARMSTRGGFWSFRAYLSECKRLGLKILMPDVNESKVECTGNDDWVRIGLMRIKGVRQETKERIMAERTQHGPYASFPDFLLRVTVDNDEMAQLILAGLFRQIEPDLSQGALHYLYAYWKGLRKPDSLDGWYAQQREQARRSCRWPTPQEQTRNELEAYGTLISRHPLERFQGAISKIPRILARDIRQHAGKFVTLVGWPIANKEVSTKRDETMEFWSFEDETDVFHTVLFPRAYQKFIQLFMAMQLLVISGKAEQEYGAVTVNIMNIRKL